MHFSAGLVVALAVSARALPQGKSKSLRRQDYSFDNSTGGIFIPDDGDEEDEEEDEDEDEGDSFLDPVDTCAADKKNQDTWIDYDIGEWFIVVANAEDDYTEDIQDTIQSWGYTDGLYSFHCEPMQHCSGNFETADCAEDMNTARVYFINYAISNFNNWMTALSEAVDRTHGYADGMAATMVDTFTSTPDDLTIPSYPGVLTAGILGVIGALMTGPAAAATAIGGALATVAVGAIGKINDGNSIELEPKFDDFADVTKYLAEASVTLQTALGDYATWVLTSVPEQDRDNGIYYVDDVAALPSILEDGTFASPITQEQLPENIYVSLFSGAITELWNKEQAIVAKIPSDEPTLDEAPCDAGVFDGMSYCDDDGNLYVLLKYPELGSWLEPPMTDETKDLFKDLPGVDKLEDYHMSVQTVVKGSENAFHENGDAAYMDWNPETTTDFLLRDTNNLIEFVTFNFPFCDLAISDDLFEGSPYAGAIEDDDCDGECQLIYRITNGCAGSFPWDHTERVYWEDSCDWIPGGCEDFCMPGGFVGSDCD